MTHPDKQRVANTNHTTTTASTRPESPITGPTDSTTERALNQPPQPSERWIEVKAGEQREHSSTVQSSETSALPGSLEETAQMIRDRGQQVLMAPADITDPASLGAAATLVLERWGSPDLVVHNARYIGPGHMDRFVDAPVSEIRKHMEGNFFAILELNKYFVPAMIENGGGRIINLTSTSAFSTLTAPAGSGGWGIAYGSAKAAMHRLAGILAVELIDDGISVFNVDPGYTATERISQDMAKFGYENSGEPASIVGAVAAWLATNDKAPELSGQTAFAHSLCVEHGLVPGYEGANPLPGAAVPDPAPAQDAAIMAVTDD